MFRNRLKRNEQSSETSVDGYFVEGGIGTPMTQVIIAVAHGFTVAGGVLGTASRRGGRRSLGES